MLRDIELIIYDLDGVLIDSSEAICMTFNRVLNEFGEEDCPKGGIRGMIGEPLRDMYRRILPEEKHNQIERCVDRYIEIFKETAVEHTYLLDGVEDTVSFFKARGLKQSVATTKTSEETAIILKGLNVRQYFDLLLGSGDVTNLKPDPEILHLTLRKLGCKRENAAFVGDTTTDIEAGRNAGVYTIAVTTGTHARKRLAGLNPDYIVDNIRRLRNIVIV